MSKKHKNLRVFFLFGFLFFLLIIIAILNSVMFKEIDKSVLTYNSEKIDKPDKVLSPNKPQTTEIEYQPHRLYKTPIKNREEPKEKETTIIYEKLIDEPVLIQ